MNNNVMVVDDDAGILYTVQNILEEAGFAVRAVNGGRSCIEELDRGFSGLILLDVMMPGMDGWETVRAIADAGHADRNIICMLTAKHIPDPDLSELKEWVAGYVHKPFEHEELIALAREQLARLR